LSVSLGERECRVLRAVVESHMENPGPVGSGTLARQKLAELHLSPATIRNILADLDGMELTVQPYTSAGRVPTDKGYRLYIDELMVKKEIPVSERESIDRRLAEEKDRVGGLLSATSTVLSGLTRQVALVFLPSVPFAIVTRFYFVKISDRELQAVLKTSIGRIINMLVSLDEKWSEPELSEIENFLNREYAGQSLVQIHRKLRQNIERQRAGMARLRARALKIQEKLLEQHADDELIVNGASLFFESSEFTEDAEKLKSIFKTLSDKRKIIDLLESFLGGENIRAGIGSEIKAEGFENCSLVTASYGSGEDGDGAIGIIGPRRMDYPYIFGLLEYLSARLRSIRLHI